MNRFLVQNISQIYKGLQYELEKKMKDCDLDKGLYIYLTHLLINGEMNQFSLAKAVQPFPNFILPSPSYIRFAIHFVSSFPNRYITPGLSMQLFLKNGIGRR